MIVMKCEMGVRVDLICGQSMSFMTPSLTSGHQDLSMTYK